MKRKLGARVRVPVPGVEGTLPDVHDRVVQVQGDTSTASTHPPPIHANENGVSQALVSPATSQPAPTTAIENCSDESAPNDEGYASASSSTAASRQAAPPEPGSKLSTRHIRSSTYAGVPSAILHSVPRHLTNEGVDRRDGDAGDLLHHHHVFSTLDVHRDRSMQLRALVLPDIVRAKGMKLVSASELALHRFRSYSDSTGSSGEIRAGNREHGGGRGHRHTVSLPSYINTPQSRPLHLLSSRAAYHLEKKMDSKARNADFDTLDEPDVLDLRHYFHHIDDDITERSSDAVNTGPRFNVNEEQDKNETLINGQTTSPTAGPHRHFRTQLNYFQGIYDNEGTVSEPLRMMYTSDTFFSSIACNDSVDKSVSKGEQEEDHSEDEEDKLVIEAWVVDDDDEHPQQTFGAPHHSLLEDLYDDMALLAPYAMLDEGQMILMAGGAPFLPILDPAIPNGEIDWAASGPFAHYLATGDDVRGGEEATDGWDDLASPFSRKRGDEAIDKVSEGQVHDGDDDDHVDEYPGCSVLPPYYARMEELGADEAPDIFAPECSAVSRSLTMQSRTPESVIHDYDEMESDSGLYLEEEEQGEMMNFMPSLDFEFEEEIGEMDMLGYPPFIHPQMNTYRSQYKNLSPLVRLIKEIQPYSKWRSYPVSVAGVGGIALGGFTKETLCEYKGRVYIAERGMPGGGRRGGSMQGVDGKRDVSFIQGCRPRSAQDRRVGCWRRLKEVC